MKVNTSISIKVDGNYYVPIRDKKVKPLLINEIEYIPVIKVGEDVKIKKSIQIKTKEPVAIEMNGHSYIPVSIIPK